MKYVFSFIKEVFTLEKKKGSVIILLNFFLGLNQGVGLLMLAPLIEVLSKGSILNSKYQSNLITKIFELTNIELSIEWVLFFFFIISATYSVINYLKKVLEDKLSFNVSEHYKNQIFECLVLSKWSFFKSKPSSTYQNNILTQAENLGYGALELFHLISNSVMLFVLFGLCIFLSFKMTIITILCFLPLLFIQKKFNHKALKIGEVMYQLNENFYNTVSNFISGFKLMKSSGWESDFINYFSKENKRIKHKSLEYAKSRSHLRLLYEVGVIFIICTILYLAVTYFSIHFLEIFLLLIITARMFPIVLNVFSNYQHLLNIKPSFLEVNKLINLAALSREPLSKVSDIISFPKRKIELKNISVSYGNQKVIDDFSCDIRVNEMNLIVGLIGAGKSTLVDVLMGLIIPFKGEIYLDKDLITEKYLMNWRSEISYVDQNPFLFNKSIKDNISIGEKNGDVSSFLKQHEAFKFVFDLPKGLDTIVGENGLLLSGGQKQLISIARALYRQPKLLILDESTSSLDEENEMVIINLLRFLKNNMTIVMISHKLSVKEYFNHIITLN